MTLKINDNGFDRPMTDLEANELQSQRQLYPAISVDLILERKVKAKSKLEALGLDIDDLDALGL